MIKRLNIFLYSFLKPLAGVLCNQPKHIPACRSVFSNFLICSSLSRLAFDRRYAPIFAHQIEPCKQLLTNPRNRAQHAYMIEKRSFCFIIT